MRRGKFELIKNGGTVMPYELRFKHSAPSGTVVFTEIRLSHGDLSRLEQLIEWALESERNRCEGCKRPATTSDSEGVPLCRKCFDALAEAPGVNRVEG